MKTRRFRAELRDGFEPASDAGRWIISYADFITLLFAFFVVMYSISSVNDGKFRVLSDSMATVFKDSRHRPVPIDLDGAPVGETSVSAETLEEAALESLEVLDVDVKPLALDPQASVRERVESVLAPLLDKQDVKLRDGKLWLEVELPSELLFQSGRAQVSRAAQPLITRMAAALHGVKTPIRVEGFTDDRPINSAQFGSNWQLSAARAAAVVDRFAADGIDPLQLSAIGFGEYHPVADNATQSGRQQNRRVVVAIAKHDSVGSGGPVASMSNDADVLAAPNLHRVTRLPGAIGIL